MSLSGAAETSMVLRWSAATGATGYRIGWTESGTGRTWDTAPPHYRLGDSPLTLINLTAGHSYTVRITPYNDLGDGPTTTRTGSTTEAAPSAPGSVSSMSLSGATSNTLVLRWGSAARATGYKIGWTESGTGRTWTTAPPHYRLGDSPLTLINLTAGHSYTVRITPYNDAGDGPTTTRTASTTA